MGVKKYSYGNLQMDEKAFREFLYKNNSRSYVDYMKGKKMVNAGWWTMGAGLAAMLGPGVAFFVISKHAFDDPLYYVENVGYKFMVVGATFMGIGGASVLSSFPILSVGYKKKKNVIYSLNNDSYIANNPSATSKPAVNLSVQSSQNGIGLALNF